jgi:serine protease Do
LTNEELSPQVLDLQEAFVKVSERIKPAVVNISTIHMIETPANEFYFGDPFEEFFDEYGEFFGQPRYKNRQSPKKNKYKTESGGSGVIIDPEGYILTNEHVVHDADEIKVRVNIDGEDNTYPGKVIGKDSRTDLAIIKITAGRKLPSAPLADSSKIRVGQWVIAIGSPFGLEQTVTSGIVSAVRQSVMVENRNYKDFIQTDASINRGNSGGPLCNIRGEVLGINTAIYAPTGVFSGIGFAIPINRAKEIMDDLIHKGKVIRGWLGVEIKSVDEAIMKQFNLPDKTGALINSIIKDSPAEKAGLKRGDVIREFDGTKISSTQELQTAVSATSPKKKVKLRVIRDGKEQQIDLVIGEMPDETTSTKQAPEQQEQQGPVLWFGMEVVNLNDSLRQRYGIAGDEQGVVVINVESDEKAAEMGMSEGDLIKSINRIKINDTFVFSKIIKQLKLSDGIVIDIIRQGTPMFLSYTE